MSDKILYIHIGTPKTGTTTLQHFLADNTDTLLSEGILYPKMPFTYRFKDPTRNALFLCDPYYDADGIRDKAMEKLNRKEGLDILAREFKDHDTILLSNEGIWVALFARKRGKRIKKDLLEFKKRVGCDIRFIVYLRRQDVVSESWWNQTIKHSQSSSSLMTWDEYISCVDDKRPPFFSLDYEGCIESLAEAFGKDSVIVKRYKSGDGDAGTLMADFLKIFGIELTDKFQSSKSVLNTGRLNLGLCEVKRELNKKLTTHRQRQFAEKVLVRASRYKLHKYSDRDYTLMSYDERKKFIARYKAGNDKIADKYINDGHALFSAVADDMKPKWDVSKVSASDRVVGYLIYIFAKFLR